jgi:glycosyltransferase involved in cell wall biosynthesis
MRVLVNALPLRYGGGTSYLRQQMAALARVDPSTSLHTLLSPWTELDGLPGTTETVPVRSVLMRFAYEQTRLPLRKTDILYCPANFAPMYARAPIVLTLHNANYYGRGLRLQEAARSRPPWKVKANHWAMKRADIVVAISESLAAEVLETVPSVANKLHIIRSGPSEWPGASTPVRGLPTAYVTSVASPAPHKRVQDVVAGWARSRDLSRADVALVLVGGHTPEQLATYRSTAGVHADQLVHLGHVSDRAQIKWIYEHALAMVSMSLLEAFPLTPAEAGSVGCPLVLSDIPAHREVTQGNGVFVPTRDVEALAHVLACGFDGWTAGGTPWVWPFTWLENAGRLHELFLVAANEPQMPR